MSQSTSPNGAFGVSNLRKHSKTLTNIITFVLARYDVLGPSSLALWRPGTQKGLPRRQKDHQGAQSDPKDYPKMNTTADKNGTLGLNASIGCPCAPLDHQNGGQVPKMEPSSLQNHGFGCLVTPKNRGSHLPLPPPLKKIGLSTAFSDLRAYLRKPSACCWFCSLLVPEAAQVAGLSSQT